MVKLYNKPGMCFLIVISFTLLFSSAAIFAKNKKDIHPLHSAAKNKMHTHIGKFPNSRFNKYSQVNSKLSKSDLQKSFSKVNPGKNDLPIPPSLFDDKFPSTDGYIATEAYDPVSNTLYIGGTFNFVGPYTGSCAEISTASGNASKTFPKIDGEIDAIVPDGSGGWFIGGYFSSINGIAVNNLAHINADKTLDESWNVDANSTIWTLALSPDGSTLYAGGGFTHIGTQDRDRFAAINAATGEVITGWVSDTDNDIYSLIISPDGSTIYAGGSFTSIGGQNRDYIAAIDASTGNATDWNTNANDYIMSLVPSIDWKTIYAGGYFTNIGGQDRNHIAAIDTATGNATDWNPDANDYIFTLAVSPYGKTIYAGGYFTSIGGQDRNYIAAIDSATGNAAGWDPNPNDYPYALAVSSDGSTVYAGGYFTNIGGQDRNYIAALDTAEGNATDWNPFANSHVNVLNVSSDGTNIFAGGTFTIIGGKPRQNIAAIDCATGYVKNWKPDADEMINILKLSSDGTIIYAGGQFTNIGGQPRNSIAALNTSTGNAADWNPNADFAISTLAISQDGSTIYAGGEFTHIGGQDRNNIAAINAETGNATGWNPNANALTNSLVISHDGSTIFASGYFTNIGGLDKRHIAAIDVSSGNATSWNPDADDNVYDLVLSPDGSTIYASGSFSNIGGQPRDYVAALETSTGNAADWWNPAPNGPVSTVAISGSTIYVAGAFTSIGGELRNGIATVNASNGNIEAWNPDVMGYINCIVLSPVNNEIYIGGMISSANGTFCNTFAALKNPDDPMPVELTNFTAKSSGGNVTLSWQTATEVNNYGFEVERASTSSATGWEKIGFVQGSGNSNSPKDYSFVDANPPSGNLQYRLKQVDIDGDFKYYSNIAEVNFSITDINDKQLPKVFSLSQNYPNPFNPSTVISYQLPVTGNVELKLFDVLGKEVTTLVNEEKQAGEYIVKLDAGKYNLTSGIYFYRISVGSFGKAGNFVSTKKLLLMK